MSKEDFLHGQSKVDDFWKFINDRHAIYLKRKVGEPKPWSDDPIFQEWKFTNVFRELDRGTIALRRMLRKAFGDLERNKHYEIKSSRAFDPFNEHHKNYIKNQFITCILYRMFNWHGNAKFGPIDNPTAWYKYLRNKQDNGDQIFGGAYILPSVKDEEKLVAFERVCREIVLEADDLISDIMDYNTLKYAWELLQNYNCIGPFIAYEFVCDLRYTDILRNATDTCTWCNIGPGAERGLQRMGFDVRLEFIKGLYNQSLCGLSGLSEEHWIFDHWRLIDPKYKNIEQIYPYWELREIEHCLCEFDKYERVRLGQGRPKVKFSGMPS